MLAFAEWANFGRANPVIRTEPSVIIAELNLMKERRCKEVDSERQPLGLSLDVRRE